MKFETIELTVNGAIAHIALNRPDKLNSINATMLGELDQALDHVESNEDVLAIVLSGNGRSFCAGFDLSAGIEANRQGVKEWRATLENGRLILLLYLTGKPFHSQNRILWRCWKILKFQCRQENLSIPSMMQ